MQAVRWIGFANSSTMTKTLVHFYPSNGTVSAPYSAFCKISLFGAGYNGESVVLDGLRLSHPDGLRIDEAFPKLREFGSSSFGIEIELSTNQPRTDLSSSICVIELRSGEFSAKYFPYKIPVFEDGAAAANPRTTGFAAIRDAYSSSSLVLVNIGNSTINPKLLDTQTTISCAPVAGQTVQEIEIPESFWEKITPREQSWGLVRARGLYVEHTLQDQSAYFVMARDTKTKAPLSVTAL